MIHLYYSFILSYYSFPFLNILYYILLYIVLSYSLSFPFTSFKHHFYFTKDHRLLSHRKDMHTL